MAKLVTSTELERIVRAEKRPAIVLFFGEWCIDCREFKPTWERWIKGRKENILAVEVLRGGPEWKEWSLREIPTVARFDRGAEIGRADGTITEDDLDRLNA